MRKFHNVTTPNINDSAFNSSTIIKTQASYQHHMLQMISQLVQQQRQANYINRMIFQGHHGQLKQVSKSINNQLNYKAMAPRFTSKNDRSNKEQSIFNNELENTVITRTLDQCHLRKVSDHIKKSVMVQTQKQQRQIIKQIEKTMKKIQKKVQNQQKIQTQLLEQIKNMHNTIKNKQLLEDTIKQDKIGQGNFSSNQKSLTKQMRISACQNIGNSPLPPLNNKKKEIAQRAIRRTSQNVLQYFDNNFSSHSIKHINNDTHYQLDKIRSNQQENRNSQIKDSTFSQSSQYKNLKLYSRLQQIQTHCDKRQIKVGVSFFAMINNIVENPNKLNEAKIKTYISQWLGIVYRATASVCWNMLQSNQLTFNEIKILFTQNIIFNFIQLVKDFDQLGYGRKAKDIAKIVNEKSYQILEYLCKQYPQTQIQAPNVALREHLIAIDEKGKIQYELIRKSNIRTFRPQIKPNKNANYNSEIMIFINYLIDTVNKEYEQFEQYLQNIFKNLYFNPSVRSGEKNKNKQQQFTGDYLQKVKKYTKFKINRKIPKNTPKYTQQQIDNGIFFVKHPSILRILSKWLEELIQIVEKPQQNIRDWFYPFKKHDGSQFVAPYPIRKKICSQINKKKDSLKNIFKQIKQNCFEIEGELAKQMQLGQDDFSFLSQQQANVGMYSAKIRNALSSYLCELLNAVIKFLLQIPMNITAGDLDMDKQFQVKAEAQLKNINLISFRIFDLLRCKCHSGETEIIWLIEKFKQLHQEQRQQPESYKSARNLVSKKQIAQNKQQKSGKKKFTLIKLKDRLNQGTRDILINAQLNNGLVFQIQLGVINQAQQKQQLLDQYNHFLYELKRSTMLGPLIENVSIWGALEQRALYFDKIVQKRSNKKEIINKHQCNGQLIKFNSPMICKSCLSFSHIPSTCLSNWKCQNSQCSKTLCGECVYGLLTKDQKKQKLFNNFDPIFLELLEQKTISNQSQLPKYCIFLKKNLPKAEIGFMTTFKFKQQHSNNTFKKGVQTVLKINDKKANTKDLTQIEQKYKQPNKINNIIVKGIITDENQQQAKKTIQNLIIYQLNCLQNMVLQMTIDEIRQMNMSMQSSTQRSSIISFMHQPNYVDQLNKISNFKKKSRLLKELEQAVDQNKRNIQKFLIAKTPQNIIILGICQRQQDLSKKLNQQCNLEIVRNFAINNSSVISLEKKNLSQQIQLFATRLQSSLIISLHTNVVKLYLNYGNIKSIKPLRLMVNLTSLYFSHNEVKSLEGLQNMKKLKSINFDNNKIQDLQPISQIKSLEFISGNCNQIKSLDNIKDLQNLKDLSLYKNKIHSLGTLHKLKKLQILYLRENSIQRLDGIEDLIKLYKLNLSANTIKQLQPLQHLKDKLRRLSLNSLNLETIPKQISKLNLEELYLTNNRIKKIENLQNQNYLQVLYLKENFIEQIEGLDQLRLVKLNLDNNRIRVIKNIKGFSQYLEELYIYNNPIQSCQDLLNAKFQAKIYWTPQRCTQQANQQLKNYEDGTGLMKYKQKNLHKGFDLISSMIGSKQSSNSKIQQ